MTLLAACGRADLPAAPSALDGEGASISVGRLMSCQASFNGDQFCAPWTSNQPIRVYAPSGGVRTALGAALDGWTAALSEYGGDDVPAFVSETNIDSAEVRITGASSGSQWCGATSEGSLPITITLYSDGQCTDNKGPLYLALRHELGHAFGWNGSTADKPTGSTGTSDQCTQVLPEDLSFNTQVCAHMIEGARAAYGARSFNSSSFWSTEFVVGPANTLLPDTVEVGQTLQLVPGAWCLDRGGTTSGSYTWTSSNSSIASVSSGGGLVTGVAVGSATIRLYPTTSSSYYQSYRFKNGGFTVPITVVPQSPVPLVVTDIGRPGPDSLEPIHDPGDYLLTALIQPGDTTGVSYSWVLKFSTAPDDSTVSGWGPRTHTLTIPSPIGSYTVTAGVYMKRGSTVGIVYTRRDFTVCPATEGEYLRLATPTPPTTDAVYNCEP